LVKIFQTSRQTISQWLNRWESDRFDGISDMPRPGAPSKLTEEEQQRALELLRKNPQSVDQVLVQLK
jgi:transposase